MPISNDACDAIQNYRLLVPSSSPSRPGAVRSFRIIPRVRASGDASRDDPTGRRLGCDAGASCEVLISCGVIGHEDVAVRG